MFSTFVIGAGLPREGGSSRNFRVCVPTLSLSSTPWWTKSVAAHVISLAKLTGQMALESVQVEGLYEDLRPRPGRPQNIQKSVPSDAPRNDLRIRAMFDAATALRARWPTMDMYSYLRGEAIAARYNAILKATGVGPLDHFGGRVRLGDVDCQSMVSDIDTLAHVLKHIPPVQPASYPTGNATNTGWERLVRTAAGEWLTYPKYRPRSSAPPRFEAIPDWSVIYIIDANILQERVADLVAFGKRFRGRVKWMSLPYVEHEISQGLEPDRSVRVNGFNQMMAQGGATRLKTQNVSVSVLPTLYKPNKAPVVGKALTGDLAIRAQLGLAITGVAQRTSKKMRTLVVLATEDYVAAELLRTVTVDPKVKLECLRVDKREKGQVFQDMLWGAASGYCVSK